MENIASPDLSLIEPFAFRTTGAMPGLIGLYEGMRETAARDYSGEPSNHLSQR